MPYKLQPPGKRGPSWYVRGSDGGGSFEVATNKETRLSAARWVEEVYLPGRARERVPGAGATVGFSEAAKAYKAFSNPSKDDERLIDRVARHFGNADCRTITHAQLIAAAAELKPLARDSTKNRKVITPAAAVLHYAADQKWCDYQRIRKLWESRKSSRAPASDDTMALLVANAEKVYTKPNSPAADRNGPYKRLLFAMLYETGLRISDLLRLAWPGIDLAGGRVSVRIAKTDDIASLEVSPVIVAMMANLPTRSGRLFPWATRSGVYHWLKDLCRELGVHYTPHLSRHAMATAAQAAGMSDKAAAELGVWADPRSLHRYQHVRPDAIPGRDAGALLETLSITAKKEAKL